MKQFSDYSFDEDEEKQDELEDMRTGKFLISTSCVHSFFIRIS